MSGGEFQYQQYRLGEIADRIDELICNNGSDERDKWGDLRYYEYPPEVIKQFKIAANKLREAQVYAHRIDWLVSCDDGEDAFLRRLREDLDALQPYEVGE